METVRGRRQIKGLTIVPSDSLLCTDIVQVLLLRNNMSDTLLNVIFITSYLSQYMYMYLIEVKCHIPNNQTQTSCDQSLGMRSLPMFYMDSVLISSYLVSHTIKQITYNLYEKVTTLLTISSIHQLIFPTQSGLRKYPCFILLDGSYREIV